MLNGKQSQSNLKVLHGRGADFQNNYISYLPIHTNLEFDKIIRDKARLYKMLHGMKFFCFVYTLITINKLQTTLCSYILLLPCWPPSTPFFKGKFSFVAISFSRSSLST